MTDFVLCLCCGTHYRADGDCPNVEMLPHFADIAGSVAKWLLDHGIEDPTSHDVFRALEELREEGEIE